MTPATRIRRMIAVTLGIDDTCVLPDYTLADLDLDGMDRAELALEISYEFEIDLTDEAMDRCRTVQDVIAATERLMEPVTAEEDGA